MIHPSYNDLMAVVNSEVEPGEQPVVQSRYSIVIAASKRARQLIAGDKPLVAGAAGKKPLSTAVQELYEQKVKILTEDEEPEIETVKPFLREWQKEIRKRMSREDHERAAASKVKRQENIEELREKNNTRVLNGLMEDLMEAM